jgi:hypothetical protein
LIAAHPDYLTYSAIKLSDSHHGGEDVALYSQGPMAHMYYGLKEQNYIPHVMQYALCIGRHTNEKHCKSSTAAGSEPNEPIRGKFPLRTTVELTRETGTMATGDTTTGGSNNQSSTAV